MVETHRQICTAVEAAEKTWGIADLAADFETTARAIRFYEAEGLLTPRRAGQRRIYSRRDRTRLRLILRGKRLGFSLAEIREIFGLYEDAETGEAGQLSLLLGRIAERRAALEFKRRDLAAALEELDEVERGCRRRLGELTGGKAADGKAAT
ncbi:MerR family transcriptional regulator [Algihabitans sp.]|uniref:MerR family transcriptional regulator n=1 Tax=Algihabitans sp. TaxID=2821514 RepID=UPI003BAC1754